MGKIKNEKWMSLSREKKSAKYKQMMGISSKGQVAADERRKQVLHDYQKLLSKEKKSLEEWSEKVKKIYEEDNSSDEDNKATATDTLTVTADTPTTADTPSQGRKSDTWKQKNKAKPKKVSAYHKQIQEQEKARKKKEDERTEREKRQKEREAAIVQRNEKRQKTYQALKKKNYKGQPFLGAQVQLMLGKIQQMAKK